MREHHYTVGIAQDPLICQLTALLLKVQPGSNLRTCLLIFKECSLMVRDDSCFLGGWVKDQDVYHTITVMNHRTTHSEWTNTHVVKLGF